MAFILSVHAKCTPVRNAPYPSVSFTAPNGPVRKYREIQKLGNPDFTIKHVFYVAMRGLLIPTYDHLPYFNLQQAQ